MSAVGAVASDDVNVDTAVETGCGGDNSKQSFVVVEVGHSFELTEDELPYSKHGEILWKVVDVGDEECTCVPVWPESAKGLGERLFDNLNKVSQWIDQSKD